jgi:hypothetical protein
MQYQVLSSMLHNEVQKLQAALERMVEGQNT